MSGLPVQTTSSGIVQALLVFKEFQIWQVTGDLVTSNLALNYLSLNVGTSAPRSVVQTPYGTNFMAIDGPYVVDALGAVKPLTKTPGENEQDIQAPFIYATQPSRVAAGYSGGVYRINVDTYLNGTTLNGDYWFDLQRRRWNGPHTFAADCLSQVGNYFVTSHPNYGAKLFKAQLLSDTTTVYNDNGTAITFMLLSSSFPKDASMTQKMVVESTIELSSSGATVNYNITALDGVFNRISSVVISVINSNFTWGSSYWGSSYWSSSINIPKVCNIPWDRQLVFQKMSIQVDGSCQNNISIGSTFLRYQELGYMNNQNLG
jgi:hypothetical protein